MEEKPVYILIAFTVSYLLLTGQFWFVFVFFFKVEWENSYLLKYIGYPGKERRNEKSRGNKEILGFVPAFSC